MTSRWYPTPVFVFSSPTADRPYKLTVSERMDAEGLLCVTFKTHYHENGEISACPRIYSSRHLGDIETVMYRYRMDSPNQYALHDAYYFAHGSQGRRLLPLEIEWDHMSIHPVVYVANGSNASYPDAGIHFRCVGLANDVCELEHSEENVWRPSYDELVVDNDDQTEMPRRSFGWWQRMFCICL